MKIDFRALDLNDYSVTGGETNWYSTTDKKGTINVSDSTATANASTTISNIPYGTKYKIYENTSGLPSFMTSSNPNSENAISNTTGVGLEFYEKEIRQMVAPNVLNMLETLNIDPLGVSTDSLMLIAPPEIVGDIKKAVAKYDVAISEIGEVNNSGEPILIKEDSTEEKLVPLFREAAYTKIKKLVGETTPEDFEEMKQKVQDASDAAIAKKDKVIKHIREN